MSTSFDAIAGIPYARLRECDGLQELDEIFINYINSLGENLSKDLSSLKLSDSLSREQHSAIIMNLAPHLEAFWEEHLGYKEIMLPYHEQQQRHQTMLQFKKNYLLRHIKPRLTRLPVGDFDQLTDQLFALCEANKENWEYTVSHWGNQQIHDKSEAMSLLETWCATAAQSDEAWVKSSVLFAWPKRHEGEFLELDNPQGLDTEHCTHREGFDAQDAGLSVLEQQDHAHYCLDCHQKSGDFCSIGFPVKKGDFSQGYRVHATGETMLGCPLEEHVGEMHELYAAGHPIAALAAVMVNNPLAALTGHRVCNDCIKSCVYQKQTPVNTPAVESGVFQEVLHFPWGVELIDLLMRWNPLRQWQPIEESYQGRQVAVMGLGPAGIASMHHLLMAGCSVVGFDGAKLMPVPQAWCDEPIRDYQMLCSPLSTRPARGFGGVSEYGITVRWDKNLLTLLHVLFQRHPRVRLVGSVRFGGTLTVNDFWPMGFDHLCLALGAGLPKELRIPNSLAIGMRQASDFLMSLQLTESARPESLSLFQMRMPVVVIGGGLTAIDTATEAMAYYLQLITTVLHRYDALCEKMDESAVRSQWNADDLSIIDEWLAHARAWEQEKVQVSSAEFLRRYGGVSIVYRRHMQDSPAYRRNHEELQACLDVGVHYRACLQPESVLCDEQGHVSGLRCMPVVQNDEGHLERSGDPVELKARCILSATGARPNVAYEFEHQGTFKKRHGHYVPHMLEGNVLVDDPSEGHFKAGKIGMLTNYEHKGHRVSLVGDAHWRYQGTVVQAIASARHALPQIMESMTSLPLRDVPIDLSGFQVQVRENRELKAGCFLLTLHCPLLASKHAAGQFYRLTPAEQSGVIPEGVALLGSRLAPDDCLSFLLVGSSPSVRLLQSLEVGDDCDVMGPTGSWAHQPNKSEKVLVMGDALALAFLRSVATEWGKITWLSDVDVAGLEACIPDSVTVVPFSEDLQPQSAKAVYVIGEPDFVRQVRALRAKEWQDCFSSDCRWVAAVYGPMQCQMKGVCAQCLQWQIDPKTGERTKAVYACSWQHQPMDIIDIEHLSMRNIQSRALDQLTKAWFNLRSSRFTPTSLYTQL